MKAKCFIFACLAATGVSAVAKETPIPATELMPLESGTSSFLITQGLNKGQRVQVTLQRTRGSAGEWLLTMERVGEVYLIRRPDGELLVSRIDLTAEHQRIVYDRPVRLLPASVAPGDRQVVQTTARITNTRENTTRRGQVTHRVDPARRTTFELPAGAMQAYLVEANQTIQLDMATVTLRLEGGFAQNRGLIYGNVRYSIDKPLFFGSTTQQTVELAEQSNQRQAEN
jgi:hypothetical protein